ncbi:hypothetical protein GGS24DRAFT_512083 [Hypoxylon argillaceum]|nr:hypothetical protein GGS24DRAFT_512083 [Hypoxylon argillaceum]
MGLIRRNYKATNRYISRKLTTLCWHPNYSWTSSESLNTADILKASSSSTLSSSPSLSSVSSLSSSASSKPPQLPPLPFEPTMPLTTDTFALTPTERHIILSETKSTLLLASSLLTRAQQTGSRHDYADAHDLVQEALVLLSDPDACDPALAPLATAYLYLGHAHAGLGRYGEAYEAYRRAARAEPRSLTDSPAVGEAGRVIADMRRRGESTAQGRGATMREGGVRELGDERPGTPLRDGAERRVEIKRVGRQRSMRLR